MPSYSSVLHRSHCDHTGDSTKIKMLNYSRMRTSDLKREQTLHRDGRARSAASDPVVSSTESASMPRFHSAGILLLRQTLFI